MNRNHILMGAIILAIIACLGIVAGSGIPHEKPCPLVYIVYGSEKGDLSYTDSAYRGLFRAQEKMPFVKQEFPPPEVTRISGMLKDPDTPQPGLIITVGYNYAGDTQRLAAENPQVRFLAIDQKGIGSANTRSYEITSYGLSYLAGVLAASATRTGRVGIILGTQSDLLEGFRLGYLDGAHAVSPEIVVDQEYVQDNSTAGFGDPARAETIAGMMYRNNTDVIYTVAGFSGTGAIREAKRGPGRYIIGVDSNQTHLGHNVVLASAVKRVDRVVYAGISEYLDGSFTGGDQAGGLSEGVTGLVFNPEFASYNSTVSAWEAKARKEEARYLASRT